jgi:hypothetical protein
MNESLLLQWNSSQPMSEKICSLKQALEFVDNKTIPVIIEFCDNQSKLMTINQGSFSDQNRIITSEELVYAGIQDLDFDPLYFLETDGKSRLAVIDCTSLVCKNRGYHNFQEFVDPKIGRFIRCSDC